MKTINITPVLARSLQALFSFAAFACATLPAHAADLKLQPIADAHAALPVTASFEKKATAGERGGHYSLNLKNTSDKTLKVTVAIVESVTSHARPKNRSVPEHALKAGDSWSVDDLSPSDKVTVTAEGFAPLEMTVK
ncbi:MAG: hypothetical protein ABIZ04_00690 [Opitutus sp.]